MLIKKDTNKSKNYGIVLKILTPSSVPHLLFLWKNFVSP